MINEFELTPPMGWYTSISHDSLTENDLLNAISYIAQYLKDFGYQYIILDDSWYLEAEVDAHGFYIPTSKTFSSAKNGEGFKTLGDYIHSLKLKFGLYLSPYIAHKAIMETTYLPNSNICISDIVKPVGDKYIIDFNKYGAINYYIHLFKRFASWGVDFIRIDMTEFQYSNLPFLHDALRTCDRTMLLDIASPIIPYTDMDAIKLFANIWPICDNFSRGWPDILDAFQLCKLWNPHVGRESWPKLPFIPETLEKLFTKDEQMTLLTLCAIFKSPILLTSNFKELPSAVQSLLTNMDVLSLLRHSHAAYELYHTNEYITWTSQGPDGSRYLATFNISDESFIIATNLHSLNLLDTYILYDLWHHTNLGEVSDTFDLEVPPHGVRLIKLIKKQ